MTDRQREEGRRIPTPVVLAISSAMISVGVVAFLVARMGAAPPEPEPPEATEAVIDASTPEATAESFLDAWRKRDHEAALEIARGSARAAVRRRRAADAKLSEAERDLKRDVWDAMARSRLALEIRKSETLDDGRVTIRGDATGQFLGKPYRREVEFVLAPREERWVVEVMELGEILSDMPEVLTMPRERASKGAP